MAVTRIMGGADFGNSSYRESVGDWRDKAACLGMPMEYFSTPDRDNDRTEEEYQLDKDNLQLGLRVCAQCPVKIECYDSTEANDIRYTVRGGMLPKGNKSGLGAGRPVGSTKPYCLNGHDTSQPNSRGTNGRCRVCDRQAAKSLRSRKARQADRDRAKALAVVD